MASDFCAIVATPVWPAMLYGRLPGGGGCCRADDDRTRGGVKETKTDRRRAGGVLRPRPLDGL